MKASKTTNARLCHYCKEPISAGKREIKDHVGHYYCSLNCKWSGVYTWECSIPGKRPNIPGAWFWVTSQVAKRDGYRCKICGKTLVDMAKGKKELNSEGYIRNVEKEPNRHINLFEYHHVIPVSRNGNSMPENVVTLCHDCHAKIHSMERGRGGRSVLDPCQRNMGDFLTEEEVQS